MGSAGNSLAQLLFNDDDVIVPSEEKVELRGLIINGLCCVEDGTEERYEERLGHLLPVAAAIPKSELRGHGLVVKQLLRKVIALPGNDEAEENDLPPLQSKPKSTEIAFGKMFVLLYESGVDCKELAGDAIKIMASLKRCGTEETEDISNRIMNITNHLFYV